MTFALRSLSSALRPLFAMSLLGLAVSAAAENLVDVLGAADANDPQWKATQSNYDAQKEVLTQGRAGVLPNVALSGEIAKNNRDTTVAGTSSNASYNNRQITLQATQPLLHFDRWYQYQVARASRSQADAQFVSDEQAYLVHVVETYLAVLRATEQLAYARAEETALSRQLEQAKQRFNVGLIAITDVHETQAAYDLARVDLIVAESNLSIARAQLQMMTGRNYTQLAFPGEDMPVALPAPEGADAWAEKARAGNAQLLAARQGAKVAQENARASASGYLPTVDLFARRVETSGPFSFIPPVTSIDSTDNMIGIDFQWTLFAGGAVNSKRKQAYFQRDAAQDNLRAAEINAVEGARTQYRVLQADVLRVDARKQAIVSTQSALDAVTAGYEVGTRNVVDVLQAQSNAFAARRDLANARYDYILDLLRLHRAAGSLSRDALVAHNQWLNVSLNLDDGQPVANPNAAVGAPSPAAASAPAPAVTTPANAAPDAASAPAAAPPKP